MLAAFLQYLFSGLTVGATYALAALGFSIIYNASGVINFAQGEFIMLGGMSAAVLVTAGIPLPFAILLAVGIAGLAGLLVEKFAIEPARNAEVVTLIIITIGASLFIRGLVQVFLGKDTHSLPPFGGETPIAFLGATLLPQSVWVMGITLVVVAVLGWFFGRTLLGKAMLATSHNKLAAQLVGINTRMILLLSFGLSGVLGAVGGIIVAPITYTSYDARTMGFLERADVLVVVVTADLASLRNLREFLQVADSVYDIAWAPGVDYARVRFADELQYSVYNFEMADVETLWKLFDLHEKEAQRLLSLYPKAEDKRRFPLLPAYDHVLKCSNTFNTLDARGAISVTERVGVIQRVRKLAVGVAQAWSDQQSAQQQEVTA